VPLAAVHSSLGAQVTTKKKGKKNRKEKKQDSKKNAVYV
jgi:hypothetical protein